MTSLNSFCFTVKLISVLLLISIGLSHCQNPKPFFTSLRVLCENTLHPKTCYDTLFPLTNSHQNTHDAQFLYNISVRVAMDEISRVNADFTKNEMSTQILEKIDTNTYLPPTLDSCRNFLSLALYNLNRSLLISDGALATRETRTNFRTWLSGAGADLQTCKDDHKYAPAEVQRLVNSNLDKSTNLVSISLAFITKIDNLMMSSRGENRLRNPYLINDRVPDWLSFEDSKLLYNSKKRMTPNAVVAADGSGKYRTISEAIRDVPKQSERRFVIYVKKGVYKENVNLDVNKWNVLMYGDGMDQTIISSNRCNKTGSKTSTSATFAAIGKGFIAKDIGFRNTAGPERGQAVALMSGSDQSVFYRCKIEGYQDTLFTQKHRQFYRRCKIYGTLDFIFGEAAAVIQHSDIIVRKSPCTTNIVTAQGKWDPNSISGITIQNSTIVGAYDLGRGVRTFLGRPWKDYSTVVIMHSKLGRLIHPEGWVAWSSSNTIPDTVLYVEHENEGPGANTRRRIKCKGLVFNNSATASKYTVKSFINGDQWLPATGVPFLANF